jgi:hypothetical protein
MGHMVHKVMDGETLEMVSRPVIANFIRQELHQEVAHGTTIDNPIQREAVQWVLIQAEVQDGVTFETASVVEKI